MKRWNHITHPVPKRCEATEEFTLPASENRCRSSTDGHRHGHPGNIPDTADVLERCGIYSSTLQLFLEFGKVIFRHYVFRGGEVKNQDEAELIFGREGTIWPGRT